MREIARLNGLTVVAIDDNEYEIRGPDPGGDWRMVWRLKFQIGPVAVEGVNGLTNEALMAVVIDRLQAVEASPSVTSENTKALHDCERALFWIRQQAKNEA